MDTIEDKSAIGLIAKERQRGISEEGFTADHDDKHDFGELAKAAFCYASIASIQAEEIPEGIVESVSFPTPPADWPWESDWWRPSIDPVRNLVKAGALIAAEIDRLNRIKPKQP